MYRSCAEFITEDLLARFEPAIARAQAVLDAGADKAELIDAFLALQEVTLEEVLLKPHTAASRKQFIVRELAGGERSHASKQLQRRLRQPLNKVSIALLSRLAGTGEDDPVARIRLMTLRGQAMPLYHMPGNALELLGWKDIDPAKAALLKRTIVEQTRVLLEYWAGLR